MAVDPPVEDPSEVGAQLEAELGAAPPRSSPELDQVLAAELAARMAGESAIRWWQELTAAARAADTNDALDALIKEFLPTMARALGADEVSVLLTNPAEDELVARASAGLREEVTRQLAIRSGQGMAGRVLASRKPTLVPDTSEIEIASPVLRESGLRSLAAVPMVVGEHVLGVLHAGSYQLDRFTEVDLGVLGLLADRLAVALERVRRFETEREARRRAEQAVEQLAQILRVTASLAGAATTEEVVEVLAQELGASGSLEAPEEVSVWLLQGDRLVRAPGSRLVSGAQRPGEIELASPLPLATAAREHRALFVPPSGETGGALVPVLLGARCLGVLSLAYASPHDFPPEERDLVSGVVHQVAQALDRVRLLEEQASLVRLNAFVARTAKVMAEAEASGFLDVLDRVAVSALPELGDVCLVDLLAEDGSIQRVLARHRDPALQPLVDQLHRRYPPDPGGDHPAADVIRSRRSRWSDSMPDAFLQATTRDPDHFALTKALGFRSYLAVPLLAGEEIAGSLTFVSSGRPLGPGDLRFAESLAEQVAVVVRNARRYEEAFRTSQLLQETLLPKQLPEAPGVEAESRYLAATKGLEIGGDFYDLVTLPSGAIAFAIGDVVGHDREAAGLMGQLRSAARTVAVRVAGPARLVGALQDSWGLLGFDRLATALFGQLDPSSGSLSLASAGHYPPLLIEEPGRTRFLPVRPGPPLGVPAGVPPEWHGELYRGQLLLLYTDGAVDERHLGSDAGMEALARTAGTGPFDPAAVCDRVLAGLHPDRNDDVALLALRRA